MLRVTPKSTGVSISNDSGIFFNLTHVLVHRGEGHGAELRAFARISPSFGSADLCSTLFSIVINDDEMSKEKKTNPMTKEAGKRRVFIPDAWT